MVFLGLEQTADTYGQRLALLAAACVLCSAWLRGCLRLAPGLPRLLAALPVLCVCFAAPLLFRRVESGDQEYSEIVSVILVEFALTWLAAYKVLAWVCGRGPLAQRAWGPLQFAAVLLAPITPVADNGHASAPHAGPADKLHTPPAAAGRQGEHAGGPMALAAAFAGKVALVLVGLVVHSMDPPPIAKDFLFTIGLYAILSFAMDGPAAFTSALIGVHVSPHFDAPWASESLAEFWAKRWDLAASNALRMLIYEPLMEGHLVHRKEATNGSLSRRQTRSSTAAAAAAAAEQRRRRRALATAACFVASGLMHELQFIYMTGHTSRGMMIAFFAGQVPLLAAERQLGAALRRAGVRIPAPLRSLATLMVLLVTSHYTFWAASHRWNLTHSSLHSVVTQLDGLKQAWRQWGAGAPAH